MAAYRAISGEASCGCFGKVPVNPWYTLSLDVALVGLLLVFPPARATPGSKRIWGLPGWICAVVAIVVGIPGALAMGTSRAALPSAEGGLQGQDGLVLLMPEEWEGKRFPLFDQIDVGDRLAKGRWLVVLYHLGCGECQELLEQCQQVGIPGGEGPRQARIAFVEVPEPGQVGEKLSLDEDVCLMGCLSESREWFVSTPVLLTLRDGTVSEICETRSAEGILAMLTGSPPGSEL
ncbi:MAG: hypothetical protein HQ582_06260 [Planctomycetes bacterium]|nr:hypothetical protein [Planctomycetota bacterium]